MKDPKDFTEILRNLTFRQTAEPSTFKMSKRNQEKWAKIRKRSEQLKGGR